MSMDPVAEANTAIQDLLQQLVQLPSQPTAAVRVLSLVDDPTSSAAALGQVISTDPALSARVMHLANSPYFGLTRRVSSARQAVTVLGLQTVRALAAAVAGGLLAEAGETVPAGFWGHSVSTAAAASVVAERFGQDRSEALSLGLLHDLGAALLFRRSPSRYHLVLDRARPPASLLVAEQEEFGVSHDQAGAAVLEAWHFPVAFVSAVRHHHMPDGSAPVSPSRPDLSQVLVAAEAVVRAMRPVDGDSFSGREPALALDAGLDLVGLGHTDVEGLLADVGREAEALSGFVRWRT